MQMPIRFTVVVPTYNRAKLLPRVLDALATQDRDDYEVIAVDDGSTDETGSLIKRAYPQFIYLRQINSGPAAARNKGIAMAQGEIIAFTDDDVVVPPNWLSLLHDGYKRYPQVVGVGGFMEAEEIILWRNVLAQYERWFARSVGVGEEESVGGWECPVGGTNNMSYRKELMQEVSGFDERFRYAAGEDADLKWRICQRGHQLLYMPVKAIHLQPYTWSSFASQARTRGKGKWQFQQIHAGKENNRIHVIAGLIYRGLLILGDWFRMPDRRFAFLRFAEAFYVAQGEWGMT